MLVVDDSTADPLVAENLSTIDAGVRSYLGVPQRYNGQCLGSLCAVDTSPREWTLEDVDVLRTVADEAMGNAR